jgi:hypothetical protein
MGAGSRTGRGLGYCADYGVPGYSNTRYRFQGRRFGGFGRGRGFKRMYYATGQPGWARFGYGQAPATAPQAPVQAPAKGQEISFLEQEQKEIESELEAIKKRIAELKK